MSTEKLESYGGASERTAKELARFMAVKCGGEVADTGYGLRVIGIDRSNRAQQLNRIENRWR